jgi:hypothetical protein
LQSEPHRTDVNDRGAPDVANRQAERVGQSQELRGIRVTELRLGQRKEQSIAVKSDLDQSLAALLHQASRRLRLEAVAQGRMG